MYTIEEFDIAKTKLLKYIVYKKRTENEVRLKFGREMSEELLEDSIEYLKEAGYINDEDYIERAIQEWKALKNMSRKEIKYKLFTKGLKSDTIERYQEKHQEELEEYERKSAQTIRIKKEMSMDEKAIEQYLLKKGYREEIIKEG